MRNMFELVFKIVKRLMVSLEAADLLLEILTDLLLSSINPFSRLKCPFEKLTQCLLVEDCKFDIFGVFLFGAHNSCPILSVGTDDLFKSAKENLEISKRLISLMSNQDFRECMKLQSNKKK